MKTRKLGGKAADRGAEADEADTPERILDMVRYVAPIGCDPCYNATCHTRPEQMSYTIDDDGLKHPWSPFGLVFCNYPFSQSRLWIPKVIEESRSAPIILLSKTDTRVSWWKMLRTCPRYAARCQLDGYVRFGEASGAATFSVALWLFVDRDVIPEDATYHPRNLVNRFYAAFSNAGEVIIP